MTVASRKATIHEVDFCSQIATAVGVLVSQKPSVYDPLHEARVEGFGKGTQRRKRKDLRFYDCYAKLLLCGEVKLPGTVEGRSAFAEKLMQDGFVKAYLFPDPVRGSCLLKRGDTTSLKWFRVWHRPYGKRGFWKYGWFFASDSLVHANETIDQVCRVKDKSRWTYRVQEIDPGDFDYPKGNDSSTNLAGNGQDDVT